jgi:Xaa-Pro aminopeptidase
MAVQSPGAQEELRKAGRATVKAWMEGARAIRPSTTQRKVELAVVKGCQDAGAHGISFWPWAMAGANGALSKTLESLFSYDDMDAPMKTGDLVRLDVGCEWNHYQGDLGRTLPVSGSSQTTSGRSGQFTSPHFERV